MNQTDENGTRLNKHVFYKEVERGVGITAHEYEQIKKISSQIYLSGCKPMAKAFSEELKKNLGSDWLVSISSYEDTINELYITSVKDSDSVSFIIDNIKFQIFRVNKNANNMAFHQ